MSRIILKISGEALKDENKFVSNEKLDKVVETVKLLQKGKHKVGIVIGGGNFFRGREHEDMEKITADTIGMLGTVMNALYLKDEFRENDINTIVDTPFDFPNLLKNYLANDLKEYYDNNYIIVFGGGVGMSGYSTDSGTILAADKLKADLIIKLTNVDGVYNLDPKHNKNAIKYDKLSYDEVITNDLQVMDKYAIEECKKKKIKILVMNFSNSSKIIDAIEKHSIGTIIGE